MSRIGDLVISAQDHGFEMPPEGSENALFDVLEQNVGVESFENLNALGAA